MRAKQGPSSGNNAHLIAYSPSRFLPSPPKEPSPNALPRLPELRQIAALTLLAAGVSTLITGCGANQSSTSTPAATTNIVSGNVHGGQQPVIGTHIYLYAAGTTGYGAASVSLLKPAAPGVFTDAHGSYVLTQSGGSFDLTNAYTCTSGQQMYLLAQGGNPGLASGSTNPALTLITALGPCTSNGRLPFYSVNLTEVSTVAAVYALSGFMTDPYHVSAPSNALAQQGLANAFLAANNLSDPETGTAAFLSVANNGVAPQPTVNTLANVLTACVNSTGATTACTTLFANTHDASGGVPVDTATAVLNIAHNPGANVTALYNLAVPTPAFQPSLTIAPNDWTVGITFYGDLMAGPYYAAFDALGNLWVPDYANDTLTQFDPRGVPLSGDNGFSGNNLDEPYAIAVDSKQNVWTVNYAYGVSASVSRFTPNG